MFEGAFSFRGRIGRLNFFLNSVLALVVFAVAVIALVIVGRPAPHDGTGLVGLFAALALLGIVWFWFGLSLQVRRIRDIGWDPVVVIVGDIALNLLDIVLARAVPTLAVRHGGNGTFIAPLLNAALTLALLFWPGRGGADDRSDDPLPGGGFGRRTPSVR